MSATSTFTELRRIELDHPPRGVIGLVDDLLRLCPEQGLRLDWHASGCRIRAFQDGSEEVFEKPLSKSVFRAILARIAALCNERAPNSVTLFGGQGELQVGANPPVVFRVAFVNTTDEQRLALMPAQSPAINCAGRSLE
jgi:hypothetical protein